MLDFSYYNHLGFHNPYYHYQDKSLLIDSDLSNMINAVSSKTLDFTALVQILSTGYAFGDRTLIQEIKKTPWMAKPNGDKSAWCYFDLPKHNELNIKEDVSADRLYLLLEKELLDYVKNHGHIGILLTGGMDSRIVAAILNNLIKEGKLSNRKITAYTWGGTNSRDVVYARRVANMFGWDWKHVIVDIEQMHRNIELTIESGCEFTPIHLHAMSKVADEKELDCVLAGSFGDSIGRGEYSGIRVKNLQNLADRINNSEGILRNDFLCLVKKDTDADIAFYHQKFPEKTAYQQNELDMQLHYMRRMLNPCMNVINKKIPLYQMFTSPAVFSYIWSINPDFRTDIIYKSLLEKYSPELLNIPWARTGLRYPEKQGNSDQFLKRHHDYGGMIRRNFFGYIEHRIKEHKKTASLLFNYGILRQLIRNCKKYPMKNSFNYEEKLLWIAALLEFLSVHNIDIDLREHGESNFVNLVKQSAKYKLKYYYKRFR